MIRFLSEINFAVLTGICALHKGGIHSPVYIFVTTVVPVTNHEQTHDIFKLRLVAWQLEKCGNILMYLDWFFLCCCLPTMITNIMWTIARRHARRLWYCKVCHFNRNFLLVWKIQFSLSDPPTYIDQSAGFYMQYTRLATKCLLVWLYWLSC